MKQKSLFCWTFIENSIFISKFFQSFLQKIEIFWKIPVYIFYFQIFWKVSNVLFIFIEQIISFQSFSLFFIENLVNFKVFTCIYAVLFTFVHNGASYFATSIAPRALQDCCQVIKGVSPMDEFGKRASQCLAILHPSVKQWKRIFQSQVTSIADEYGCNRRKLPSSEWSQACLHLRPTSTCP